MMVQSHYMHQQPDKHGITVQVECTLQLQQPHVTAPSLSGAESTLQPLPTSNASCMDWRMSAALHESLVTYTPAVGS